MPRLAALGFALALAPGGLGAQTIPVTVGGPASSLVGVPFNAPIQVDLSGRPEKLGSFLVRLQWNPAVIRIDSGSNGDFGEVYSHEDSMPLGVLRLTGANPAGVGGKVTIGIGYVVPLLSDTTTIKVQVLELYAAGSFVDLAASAQPTNRQYCPGRGRYGDLNGDNGITAVDAQIALMAAVGLPLPAGTDAAVGDLDGDSKTDTRDALVILSNVVGLDTGPFRLLRVAPGACGTDRLATLALDVGDQTLVVGQQLKYGLRFLDSAQNASAGSTVTWSSTNAGVATVTSGGVVVAAASGQTVLTAREAGGRQASAIVTVVNARRKHVVDALAFNANNQLGSASLPFSTIQDGLSFAQAGDTVFVRRGRYEGAMPITRSVTVLSADTGQARPLISGRAGTPADSGGFVITGGARVELRALRFDTLYQAVHVRTADTVVISDASFRARSVGLSTVYVDSVSTLRIRRSRFDGSLTPQYAVAAVYVGGWARVLDIDSTLVTDYGDDAVQVYGVDSLIVRNSIFRFNRGVAVYAYNVALADSARVMRAVFSRNLMTQNYLGDVLLYDYRSAAFDHNLLVGGGYDGIQLYGDGASVISFVGDSMDLDDGYWLEAQDYDSLSLDSVKVRTNYYSELTGGRINVVRNSAFQTSDEYAFEIDPSPRDSSRLILRNVSFKGDRDCDQCASGVYSYATSIDADGITAENLDYVFDMSDLGLVLTNSTFTHVYEPVYSDCGSVRVDHVVAIDTYYGFEAYGCDATDSLVVDHATISSIYTAIEAEDVSAVIRNSVFHHGEYGLQIYSGSLLAEDNQFQMTGQYSDAAIYFDAGAEGPATIRRNTITCDVSSYDGMDVYDAAMTITDNVLTGCRTGIYVSNSSTPRGTPIEIRGNTVTMAVNGSQGITSVGSKEFIRVVGNTVTGPAPGGSISLSGSANPRSLVDSNTITGGRGIGIRGGRSDTTQIIGNILTNLVAGPCCGSNGAIVLNQAAATTVVSQVIGNRITFSKTHGIVVALPYTGVDTVTVLVDSNAIRGADSMGVWVQQYSHALIRKNAIDSSGMDAIRVSDNYLVTYENSTVAQQNSLTRSKHFGLQNIIYYVSYPYTVEADNNWWGDASGPICVADCPAALGDSVSNDVNFTPFLTSAPADVPIPAPAVLAASASAPVVLASPRPAHASVRVRRPGPAPVGRLAPAPATTRLPRSVPSGVAGAARAVDLDRAREALETTRLAGQSARHREREAKAAQHAETRKSNRERAEQSRAAKERTP